MARRRPIRVRMGYAELEIHLVPQDDAALAETRAGDGPANGAYDYDRHVIKVADALSPRETVHTTLHELVHAAAYIGGAHFRNDDEEEAVVGTVASQLTHLFIENPHLFEWLREVLGSARIGRHGQAHVRAAQETPPEPVRHAR